MLIINEQNAIQHSVLAHQIFGGGNILGTLLLVGRRLLRTCEGQCGTQQCCPCDRAALQKMAARRSHVWHLHLPALIFDDVVLTCSLPQRLHSLTLRGKSPTPSQTPRPRPNAAERCAPVHHLREENPHRRRTPRAVHAWDVTRSCSG